MDNSQLASQAGLLKKNSQTLKQIVCWLLIFGAIYFLRDSGSSDLLLSISFFLILIASICGLLLISSFKKDKVADRLSYEKVFKFIYIEAIGGTVIILLLIVLSLGCLFNDCMNGIDIITAVGSIVLMICPLVSLTYFLKAKKFF